MNQAVVSDYQRTTYCSCEFQSDHVAAANRMLELVEQGMGVVDAGRAIGVSGTIRAKFRERWSRIVHESRVIKEDRYDSRPITQRKFEELVRFMCSGDMENEWALPIPFKPGTHLIGKRHNITKPYNPVTPTTL